MVFEKTHHHIGLHDWAAYQVSSKVNILKERKRKIPSNVASTCEFVSFNISEKPRANVPNPSKYCAETDSKPIPPFGNTVLEARKAVKYQNMSATASNNDTKRSQKLNGGEKNRDIVDNISNRRAASWSPDCYVVVGKRKN